MGVIHDDKRLIAAPYLLHSARDRADFLQGSYCVDQADAAGQQGSEYSQQI